MKDFAQMEFTLEMIKIFIPVAGSLLIAIFTFMSQKEYELVRTRYLVNGLDVLTSYTDTILASTSVNYLRSLQLLKIFRDIGPYMQIEEIDRDYVNLHGFLPLEANERLKILLGGNLIFWEAQQLLFTDASDANLLFQNTIKSTLLKYLNSPQDIRNQIVDTLEINLKERHMDLMKYWIILSELHVIKRALEKEKFSFIALDDFPHKVDVRESIKRIEANFGKKLSELNIPPLQAQMDSAHNL